MQERKDKRQAELKKAKANKDEVARELARLDEDAKNEERRVEVSEDHQLSTYCVRAVSVSCGVFAELKTISEITRLDCPRRISSTFASLE